MQLKFVRENSASFLHYICCPDRQPNRPISWPGPLRAQKASWRKQPTPWEQLEWEKYWYVHKLKSAFMQSNKRNVSHKKISVCVGAICFHKKSKHPFAPLAQFSSLSSESFAISTCSHLFGSASLCWLSMLLHSFICAEFE